MMKMNPKPADVVAASKKLRRPVEPEQAELLAEYLNQLVKWNKKMNLVGPSDWKTIFDTLVVDSLFLADFMTGLDLPDKPLCLDLGAGAGLPGIPLRTLWQKGDYWLVEIRDKRAMFMRSVLGKLNLPGTSVFHGKAEDALERLTESGCESSADVILSRAFMPWPKLLDFIHPMLRNEDSRCGVAIILANTPPPAESELPKGWILDNPASYPAAKRKRFFWSLRPVPNSRG
ncbi:MAG: 16S rRNA (guanine(527)-N(7))-methyltransferase RsmG [Pseudodesulfovibrio sp.]|nr:16S rRNA (guanine(527)-N(7))-methyltransferase RsmG [Pseudodesulfovibrio sp.]